MAKIEVMLIVPEIGEIFQIPSQSSTQETVDAVNEVIESQNLPKQLLFICEVFHNESLVSDCSLEQLEEVLKDAYSKEQ